MESCNDTIILFHPLNTLYTYNSNYLPRVKHEEAFTDKSNKITLLPYIQKDILDNFKQKGFIAHFKYLIDTPEEIAIIEQEHNLLSLNTYYPFSYILKKDLSILTQRVIMISENVEDFTQVQRKSNFCKIVNWMIYNENEDYLAYQDLNVKLLSFKEQRYDLIIESFRQANNIIDYLLKEPYHDTSMTCQDSVKKYFAEAINVLYIFDCNSKAKTYRKRELANSSQLIKYLPFIHKHFGLDNELSCYPQLHVFLQRCPYFYLKNKDKCHQIQSMINNHPEIAQLHNMNVIDMVYNRYALYDFLMKFLNDSMPEIKQLGINLTIPLTLKYTINTSLSMNDNHALISKAILDSSMKYPYVIKPDSGTIHEMKLILNEDGLKTLFSSEESYAFMRNAKDVIVQQFIEHGGSMIKNYCINGQSHSFVRPSLPDMKGDILKSKELSQGTFSFANEMIYQGQVDSLFNKSYEDNKLLQQIDNAIIDKITGLFIEKTGITLFGLDYLYNKEENMYCILEVNYFPSYRELGSELPRHFAEHITKYYTKHKGNNSH